MARHPSDKDPATPGTARALISKELRDLLAQLGELTDVKLELSKQEAPDPPDCASAPVMADGKPTGWKMVARARGQDGEAAVALAARFVGTQIAAGAHDLSESHAYLENKLNFLYEMSRGVGSLLDEQDICNFVIERTAWLLDCERASLMLFDPESQALKIRASIGVPEHIAATTAVKPGERISGKVFESGQKIIIDADDPMPSESLGVRELEGVPSFMSVPLTTPPDEGEEEQILGVINLTRKAGGGALTASDEKLVTALAAHTAAQIRNCRLINAEHERRRLEEELAIAASIQLSLLPKEPLAAGPLEAAGVCRLAKNVGGDFFDYWEQEGRVCLLVADVAGHDLGAALMATAFRSVVRAASGHGSSVAQIASQVNWTVYDDLSRAELLVTACYMEIELATGVLTYACCAHPHPLLMRGSEQSWLETTGPMFGIERDAVFDQETVRLAPGDVLIAYTDGLLEAGAPEDEQFGTERLGKAAADAPHHEPVALAESIMGAVVRHVGSAELWDDVTILVARLGGGAKPGGGKA